MSRVIDEHKHVEHFRIICEGIGKFKILALMPSVVTYGTTGWFFKHKYPIVAGGKWVTTYAQVDYRSMGSRKHLTGGDWSERFNYLQCCDYLTDNFQTKEECKELIDAFLVRSREERERISKEERFIHDNPPEDYP
jgi:hypothetical protein